MAQPAANTVAYESNKSNKKRPGKGKWIIAGLFILVIGAFIFLRTKATDVGGSAELSAMLQDGQPKVLEFYSNY